MTLSKAVAPFRQGHKTDSNDALAVAEAARRQNIKEAPMKTAEQQGLQAIQRSREQLIGECTARSNHLRGILLEFGVAIPQGFASLLRALPDILEDGDNELVKQHPVCSRLTAIEGIGPIGALSLYAVMGSGKALRAGDSVSNQRTNIQTRLNSDHLTCLLDWRSPYTKRTLVHPRIDANIRLT